MEKIGRKREAGMTVIELLTAVAIIAALAGLGLNAVQIYRQKAYQAQSFSLLRAAQAALSAGADDLESSPIWFRSAWTRAAGPVVGWSGEPFMPGYINPENVQLSAWYSAWCETANEPWCFWQGVDIKICEADTRLSWRRFWNGEEFLMQMPMPPGWC